MMEYNKEFTVFVGNLNEKVTKDLLFEIFLQMGPVLYCTIIDSDKNSNYKKNDVDKVEDVEKNSETEKPYRYGFVVFEHSASVSYACKMMKDVRLYGDKLVIKSRGRIEHKERSQGMKNEVCLDRVQREKPKESVSENCHVVPVVTEAPSARSPKVFYNSQYRSSLTYSSPEQMLNKSFSTGRNERRSIYEYRGLPKPSKKIRIIPVRG